MYRASHHSPDPAAPEKKIIKRGQRPVFECKQRLITFFLRERKREKRARAHTHTHRDRDRDRDTDTDTDTDSDTYPRKLYGDVSRAENRNVSGLLWHLEKSVAGDAPTNTHFF